MFEDIFTVLYQGELPDFVVLRKRFDLAVIKKMGVLKQPPAMWPVDPKINPPSKSLLFAALLLDDKEAMATVYGIVQAEVEERLRARGRRPSAEEIARLIDEAQQQIQPYLEETGDEVLRNELFIRAQRFGMGTNRRPRQE